MSKRLFVAIDLPESMRQLLAGLDPHIRGMRWTDPAQIHLTLGFFGDVPEDIELKLREKLSAIRVRGVFSSCECRRLVFGKRRPENHLDRRGQSASASVSNSQARAGGGPRWRDRTGASSLASARHDRALQGCLCAISSKVFESAFRFRCRNDSR